MTVKKKDEVIEKIEEKDNKEILSPEPIVEPTSTSFRVEKQPETLDDLKTLVLSAGVTNETFDKIEENYIEYLKSLSGESQAISTESQKPVIKPIGIIGIGKDLLTGAYLYQSLAKYAQFHHVVLDGVESMEDAIEIALNEDSIAEGFIIFPENVFLISPVILADIQVLKAKGVIKSGCGVGDRTIELSASNGFKTRQISPDCPVYLEKSKVIELLEKFPNLEIDEVDFLSLYFNAFYPEVSALELDYRTDNVLLPIVSADPKIETIEKYISGKKFVKLSENSQSGAIMRYFSERVKIDQ